MPSLHKILKLQAGCRGRTHRRLTQTKGANQILVSSSDHNLVGCASVVNPFVTLFSPARWPSSRAVDATSSLVSLGPLASSLSFSTANTAVNPLELVPTHSRGRPRQVVSKFIEDGGNSHPRLSTEGSSNVFSALRNGAWTERRWVAVRAGEKTFGGMSRIGSRRICVEENEGKVEHGGWSFESTAGLEMVWRLSKASKVGDSATPRVPSSLHLACQIGTGGTESWRSFQNCLLSLYKLNGTQVGFPMGGLCTTPMRNTTAGRGALRLQDFAGQVGKAAVKLTNPGNALFSRFFNHRRGVKSPVRVSPLRAAHDVSLARDGLASRSEHQSDESARAGHTLKFQCGACNLPHPEKLKTGGEDAYFICKDRHVFGVADGVGGWSDLGIDAGQYARELMSHAAGVVREDPTGCMDPLDVMEKAHSLTRCRGSSTACILALTDSSLEAANLGDSGFMVVRNNRTVFKSPSQQHQFNIPFQLEHGGSDPPRTAQLFSVPVREGDVVIVGTDGLFDNVYDTELITHVVQAGRGHLTPQVTAERIANLARSHAKDKNRQTPFSTAAQDAGFRFFGGKMDDITVIVSYVMSVK